MNLHVYKWNEWFEWKCLNLKKISKEPNDQPNTNGKFERFRDGASTCPKSPDDTSIGRRWGILISTITFFGSSLLYNIGHSNRYNFCCSIDCISTIYSNHRYRFNVNIHNHNVMDWYINSNMFNWGKCNLNSKWDKFGKFSVTMKLSGKEHIGKEVYEWPYIVCMSIVPVVWQVLEPLLFHFAVADSCSGRNLLYRMEYYCNCVSH